MAPKKSSAKKGNGGNKSNFFLRFVDVNSYIFFPDLIPFVSLFFEKLATKVANKREIRKLEIMNSFLNL